VYYHAISTNILNFCNTPQRVIQSSNGLDLRPAPQNSSRLQADPLPRRSFLIACGRASAATNAHADDEDQSRQGANIGPELRRRTRFRIRRNAGAGEFYLKLLTAKTKASPRNNPPATVPCGVLQSLKPSQCHKAQYGNRGSMCSCSTSAGAARQRMGGDGASRLCVFPFWRVNANLWLKITGREGDHCPSMRVVGVSIVLPLRLGPAAERGHFS
jgi:hypothetical protein